MGVKLPDAAALHEAALNHLARYAATEAGLARVLARKVDRGARLHAEDPPDETAVRRAKAAIPGVISKLKAAGVLDDNAFAASRAKRLNGEG